MLKYGTPVKWQQSYALHRRKRKTDHYGEQVAWYDMEQPDEIIPTDNENSVCWQEVKTWQTGSQLSSGGKALEQGELERGVLQGALFGPLEVALFDRFVVNGSIYELRNIQHWPGHRMLQLQHVEQ